MINFVFPGASRQEVKEKAHLLSDALRDKGYNFDVEPGAGEFQDLIAVGLCGLFYDAVYEDGPVYEIINGEMRYLHDH